MTILELLEEKMAREIQEDYFFKILYLFKRENERGRACEGGVSRELDAGLQDHYLSRRQSLNQLSHLGGQYREILNDISILQQ